METLGKRLGPCPVWNIRTPPSRLCGLLCPSRGGASTAQLFCWDCNAICFWIFIKLLMDMFGHTVICYHSPDLSLLHVLYIITCYLLSFILSFIFSSDYWPFNHWKRRNIQKSSFHLSIFLPYLHWKLQLLALRPTRLIQAVVVRASTPSQTADALCPRWPGHLGS